jgi:hypothetical protein
MSAMTRRELEQLVPPLHGCTLCMYSDPSKAELLCACPAVRDVHGLQPVRVVRALSGSCGPGAAFMDMPGWRAL